MDLHACISFVDFFFFCSRQAYLEWMLKEMGGEETVVLSVHLANHTT